MPRMGVGAQVKTRLYLEGFHVENALMNVQCTGTIDFEAILSGQSASADRDARAVGIDD